MYRSPESQRRDALLSLASRAIFRPARSCVRRQLDAGPRSVQAFARWISWADPIMRPRGDGRPPRRVLRRQAGVRVDALIAEGGAPNTRCRILDLLKQSRALRLLARALRHGSAPSLCRQRNGATQVGRKTKAIAAAGRTTSSCRHQRGGRPLGRCRQRATSRALLLFGPVLGTCVPRGKVAASASGSRTAAWACGSDQSQVFAGARSSEPGWPARVCRFHGRHVPPKSR